ncbi:hypothetical protein JCM5350_005391 [Sporobolomyces pararoseus]
MVEYTSVDRLSNPSIPQFTAWMSINGKDTPMYGVEQQPGKTICYVESQTGQNFAINYRDSRYSRRYGYQAAVCINSKNQRSYVHDPNDPPFSTHIKAVRTGSTTERPFVFCDIPTTSDPQLATLDESTFKSLGSVALRIRRFQSRITQPLSRPRNDYAPSLPRSVPVIHEDSKKAALTHAVSLGASEAPIRRKTGHQYLINYLDTSAQPFHIFEFRYRTRAVLELQDLVPPTPYRPSLSLSHLPPPALPVAGPSNPSSNTSSSSTKNQSQKKNQVIVISDDEDEARPAVVKSEGQLAELEEELAELERQSRMARIRRELAGASQSENYDSVRVKREGEANENGVGKKKVKLERENFVGKKGKGEVLVLSDSE